MWFCELITDYDIILRMIFSGLFQVFHVPVRQLQLDTVIISFTEKDTEGKSIICLGLYR